MAEEPQFLRDREVRLPKAGWPEGSRTGLRPGVGKSNIPGWYQVEGEHTTRVCTLGIHPGYTLLLPAPGYTTLLTAAGVMTEHVRAVDGADAWAQQW